MKPLLANRLAILAVFALALYLVICCASFLEWDASGNLIAHSYSVWGDWSAHFTFIQNLRERGLHWLAGDNPVFAGAPFQYPFLSHLITAGLGALFGVSTLNITEGLSLSLLFVAPLLVYRIYRQFGLTAISAFVSVTVFFLSGGYQWMGVFNPAELNPKEALTNHFDNGSVFTQFVAFEFYPQRAFLFGLLILVGVGTYVIKKRSENKLSFRTAVWTGFALSLLALTHVHSYLALATFLLFYFALNRNKKVFIYGAGIAVTGCVFLAFLLLRDRQPLFQQGWDYWLPGWALNELAGSRATQGMNPISFWLLNTGLYLPMAWMGAVLAFRQSKPYPLARVWFFSGLALFVLANLFNLQPYWYDNLKIFTYVFFFFAPFIGVFFERVLFTRRWLYPVAVLLFCAQIYSGAADLYFLKSGNQSATFFSAAEFSIAEEFTRLRHSPDDLVIINPRHNHWATCLSGSPTLMGFPGWLWSWGLSYGGREREVNSVLTGAPNAEALIQHYQVGYVILQATERVGNQPVNVDFFRSHYSRILNRDGWEIFSTRSPSTSVR